MQCKICKNTYANEVIQVSEKMLQTNDLFEYLRCSSCYCLQILNPPENLSRYYPQYYYSYNKHIPHRKLTGLKAIRRRAAMRRHLGIAKRWDSILAWRSSLGFPWLTKNLVTLDSKILDVGCGSGALLFEMSHYGYHSLYGIDPFIASSSTALNSSPQIHKSTLENISEQDFDLIMFHHSFEHCGNPFELLTSAHKVLKNDGRLLMRMPVSTSFAFRKYRSDWVAFDAPRHLFIHSIQSLSELCRKTGFILYKVIYDSNSVQFTGSECYARGIPLEDTRNVFSDKEIKTLESEAQRLNGIGDGDSACFYLKPI